MQEIFYNLKQGKKIKMKNKKFDLKASLFIQICD